jgi:hypothetical protein
MIPFSIHVILKIVLYNNSSNAFSLFEIVLVRIHAKELRTQHLRSRYTVVCEDRSWHLNIVLIELNTLLAFSMWHFIYEDVSMFLLYVFIRKFYKILKFSKFKNNYLHIS